jgi:hypothetical protein
LIHGDSTPYNHPMRCLAVLATLFFTMSVGACSGTSDQSPNTGGSGGDGTGGTGGAAAEVLGKCVDEGYPCSPSEESLEARALSDQYMAEVQDRMAGSESMLDIAE